MAPPTPLFLLSLLFFLTFISISSSQSNPATQLLLPLTHALSRSHPHNSTTHHLLKTSALRSAARRHHRSLSLPLIPGSDYTLSFSLASPSSPTTVDLYMDTGSDLVWFPCSPFECILCEGKPKTTPFPPPPPPTASTLVACDSPFCSAAHSALPSSDLCAVASCPLDAIETSSCNPSTSPCPAFYYAYGDGSLVARLRRGPLALPVAGRDPLRLRDFAFACAHSVLAEPVGVAGFGGGLLSLPAQLTALHPGLGRSFSYCLVAHSFDPGRLLKPSLLILGRSSSRTEPDLDPFVYTPMLHNPKHPYFYSVGLEAVLVGGRLILPGPELAAVDRKGSGGMVVDSGTTFTMLPAGLHARLARVFDRRMRRAGFDRAVEVESETGLGPCYNYAGRERGRRVPQLVLRFGGNASVALPRRNYFTGFERDGRRVGCLMVMSGGDGEGDGGGPAATLGNYQQQGFEVVYDLEEKRVGFSRRPCAALWDSLSRG